MHILSIGESVLQSELNYLCSPRARGGVNNECLENLVPAVDLAWMGSFEVIVNRREVLEHRHVEVMSIGVRIRRQESLVDRIQMKRVTCGRTVGLELLPFMDKDISSKGNLSTPIRSIFVSAFKRGHEILRSTQGSSQISSVFDRKKVEGRFIGQMETCDPSIFLVKFVVSDVSRASLVNLRQLDRIDWGPWCDRICGRMDQSTIPVDDILEAGP